MYEKMHLIVNKCLFMMRISDSSPEYVAHVCSRSKYLVHSTRAHSILTYQLDIAGSCKSAK